MNLEVFNFKFLIQVQTYNVLQKDGFRFFYSGPSPGRDVTGDPRRASGLGHGDSRIPNGDG